jgi:hypothetical protein
MAVISTPVNSILQLVLEKGMGENGKPILRTKSYNRVKTSAPDEDLMEVAKQLSGLQDYPVNAIRRVIETELTEQL